MGCCYSLINQPSFNISKPKLFEYRGTVNKGDNEDIIVGLPLVTKINDTAPLDGPIKILTSSINEF
jgi:hypothetical protein